MVYVVLGIIVVAIVGYVAWQAHVDAGIPFEDPQPRADGQPPAQGPVIDTWQGIRIVGVGVLGALAVFWILFLP